MRIRFINWTRAAGPLAAALLLGWIAGPAGAQSDDAQIKKLRERLGIVADQLGRIGKDLRRDAAIHNARKAAAAAYDAYIAAAKPREQAWKTYNEAQKALGKAKMQHGKRARSLIEADAEASGLLKESERLEALARAVDARIARRRKALEAAGPVAAAKKAWTDAQARVVEARKAYQQALKGKLLSDPQMKQFNKERGEKWRRFQDVRVKLNGIKRLLLMGRGPLSAQRAYQAAVRAEKETYRAKLVAPDGGKALKVVESLGPKLGALGGRLGPVYGKINDTALVKAAKAAWDRARAPAQDAGKAYQKARSDAIAEDREGAALLRQLKQTKDPKRRAEITRDLAPHRRRADKAEKVIRARKAYQDLSRQDAAKRIAYYTKRNELVAADPEGGKLLAKIKQIRSEYDPANTKLGGFRAKANKDPDVVAARKKVSETWTKMIEANAAYEKALTAKIAARPEGKKLLQEKARLEARLKALTK